MEPKQLIRHMRRHGGLTQGEVGDLVGVDRSSISNMESGRHEISVTKLIKIADACGFDLTLSVTQRRRPDVAVKLAAPAANGG